MAETVAHLKTELLSLTSRIYVNQITQTEEETRAAPVATRRVSPHQVESDEDDLEDELVQISKLKTWTFLTAEIKTCQSDSYLFI